MCGRYTALSEVVASDTAALFGVKESEGFEGFLEKSEAFPGSTQKIIISKDGIFSFEDAQWGFENSRGGIIINARSETLQIKPAFRTIIDKGRCIVPACDFFEWERHAPVKRKYKAKNEKGAPLLMAGLWQNGKNGLEFVIITTESKGSISNIHDRMPVILSPEKAAGWLLCKLSVFEAKNPPEKLKIYPCEEDEAFNQITLF